MVYLGGLAVVAFDLINRSLSVVRFVSVFNVGQLMSYCSCRLVSYTDIVGL